MTDRQQEFDGLGISTGIGVGVVYIHDTGIVAVPEYRVPADKVEAEQDRLKRAVTLARRQIGRLRTKSRSLPADAALELGYLMDAYSHMLKDSRLVRGARRRIAEDRVNAEAAIHAEIAEIATSFEAMDDPYIAARLNDIRGIANRLMRNLTRTLVRTLAQLPKGSVIVAEELTPADTAQLNPDRVAGIVTTLGGAEGHTAIMARALGLPAVMGVSGILRAARTDDPVIVDGDAGRVIVNPAAATVARYRRRDAQRRDTLRRLAHLRRQPAVTRDDVRINLQANVELPIEMKMVAQSGAEGIGLLRSEFLFMNRDDIPGEEEQYQALCDLIAPMAGRPVTVRTLDVGGEKTAAALMGDFGTSVSSALGMRGIRLSLARTDVFEVQLQAILRAAAAHGNVRILLPMVFAVHEVRRARDVMVRAARRLTRRGVPVPDPLPPLGVMIEVPGAALSADALARASDFFAIGSNDLTMYTLAIDRRDEQVAHLYDPLHPAVLRLIQFSAEAGMRARIPVSICGEMAGDCRYTALLLGLGFRELSMTAASIPPVKQRIRDMDLVAADQRARIIMDQVDSGRIATLLDDFNALA